MTTTNPKALYPSSGMYIEKDLSINEDIEKLRQARHHPFYQVEENVIVVASVFLFIWYW